MNRILRTPEAAAYCGLSPSTLEKLRSRGDGPEFLRLGKRAVGYEIDALNAWIDRRAHQAAAHLSPESSQ